MPVLTLDAAGPTLATIDLGPASPDGYYDEGDLSPTSGNLYLYVDGVEYGSLFFHRRPDGRLTITLGAFDFAQQDWIESAVLDRPVETQRNHQAQERISRP